MAAPTLEISQGEYRKASEPAQDIYLERKANRMTLIAGLVGADGIVLAADKCGINFATEEAHLDDRVGICKIFNFEKHRVAVAIAGDEVTEAVGMALSRELDAGPFGHDAIESELERIANRAIDEAVAAANPHPIPQRKRAMLVVFYGDGLQMWRLDIAATWPFSKVRRIDGMAICGALGNSARHFEHYYQYNLPIARLKTLAAHIVLTGHAVSGLIDGLDIATFGKDGYHWLSEEEKQPLRARSKEVDRTIRELLLG